MQDYIFKLAIRCNLGTWKRVRDSLAQVFSEVHREVRAYGSPDSYYTENVWLINVDSSPDEGWRMDQQPVFFGEDLSGKLIR